MRTERRAWQVHVARYRGRFQADLFPDLRPDGDDEVDECGGYGWVSIGEPCDRLTLRVDRDAGRLRVVLPRSCLRSPRWVQAGVESSAGLAGGVQVLDAWEPRARRDDDPLTPTYGPRVRRQETAR